MSVYLAAKIKFFLQYSKFRSINSFYLQKIQFKCIIFLLFLEMTKFFSKFAATLLTF